MADTDTFTVQIKNLDRSYENLQHGISGGDMHFKRSVRAPRTWS